LCAKVVVVIGVGGVLVVLPTEAQQSTVPQSEKTRTSVTGRVLDGKSGDPISGATVALGRRRELSDASGEFSFDDVPPAELSLQASKPGYFGGGLGQLSPSGSTFPLSVVAGATAKVKLLLWRGVGISGEVQDADGRALPGMTVQVLREVFTGSKARLVASSTVRADAGGVYRFAALQPGRYVVSVPSHQSRSGSPGAFPTVFFPGVFAVAHAEVFALDSGEHRTGADFRLIAPPMFRIGGTVRFDGLPRQVELRLIAATAGEVAADVDTWRTTSDAAGRFLFSGVPSGPYVVRIVALPAVQGGGGWQNDKGLIITRSGIPRTSEEPTLWGESQVNVADADVKDLAIELQVGARIHGELKFKGIRQRPSPQQLIASPVLIRSDVWDLGRLPLSRIEPDGTFRTVGLPPGDYWISPSLYSNPDWFIEAVQVDGRPIAESVRVFSTDVHVTFDLTDQPNELSGRVSASDRQSVDATVFVFPTDRRLWVDYGWPPRWMLETTSREGIYRITGLLAGEYFVAAQRGGAPDTWRTVSYLDQLVKNARQVRIDRGQRSTLNLSVSPPK
jgi:hypothetical protein